MDKIENFLQKYEDNILKSDLQKQAVLLTIKNIIGFSDNISKDNLKINNSVLYLKVPTKIKLEILIRKQKFLEQLNEIIGREKVKDIR